MEITLAWAEDNLKAVKELITQYKTETHDGSISNCSLCRLNKCEACPWVIFKGYTCTGIRWDSGIEYRDLYYNKTSIPLRLRRLYGWQIRFRNIIRKFKEAA